MDDLDKRILTAIQGSLPVEERPFDALAEHVGIRPIQLMARVWRFANDGTIRRVGPIFDSHSLGYVSTLVAGAVPPERLEEVAEQVNLLPGVTHNYERVHQYNLWFTLTSPSQAALEATLARLREETVVDALYSLPALSIYKIRVQFNLAQDNGTDEDAARATAPLPPHPEHRRALTDEQKHLVRLLQDGLPVVHEPFADAAEEMGWRPGRVVNQLREWLDTGVVRRFGAVVRHHALGFGANGMAVFRVPIERIDEVGHRFARRHEVSHCYRRPPLPDFPYDLFAMTHGRSEDEVRAAVAAMAKEALLPRHDVLFSVREFKKVSMRYFVEDEAV